MADEGLSPFEVLAVAAIAVVAAVAAVVWGGAALAVALTGGQFDGALVDAAAAVPALVDDPGRPAGAWPEVAAGVIPGPGPYWAATGVIAAVVTAAGAAVVHWAARRRRAGTRDRRRLGVDARARFATRRELRPLWVPGPVTGRFTLGRAGRQLVATENRAGLDGAWFARLRRWRWRARIGDRGAVALVGPSRCGKTTAAVTGILEWDGPAILSSVKSDLLAATVGHRSHVGEVRIFDPTNSTGYSSSGWSPLARAGTITGARRCARNLVETLVDTGTENIGMWKNLAEYLLAGLAFVAHHSEGRDMANVVEWVLTQDRPQQNFPGEVSLLMAELLGHPDPAVARDAQLASSFLLMAWSQEDRTRSSVYVTATAAVEAWADPAVAATTATHDIDLDWLLSGANTLYLCAPIEDQKRLAPAFGGVLNDLIRQVYEVTTRTGRPLETDLLIVLDEAGNTPLDLLPEYASTLAGARVLLVTIWQSIAQITSTYSTRSGIVLTNHLSKLFYSGLSDEDSVAYVGRVLGDEEIGTRQFGVDLGASGRQNLSEMTSRVGLVQPHCLRQMVPGDALLVHASLPPAHIRTRAYYRERGLRARVALEPKDITRFPDPSAAGPAEDDALKTLHQLLEEAANVD